MQNLDAEKAVPGTLLSVVLQQPMQLPCPVGLYAIVCTVLRSECCAFQLSRVHKLCGAETSVLKCSAQRTQTYLFSRNVGISHHSNLPVADYGHSARCQRHLAEVPRSLSTHSPRYASYS